jgi:hypothetical protein
MQTFKDTTGSARAVGEKIEITYLPDNPEMFLPTEQLADSAMNKIKSLSGIAKGVIILIAAACAAFQ